MGQHYSEITDKLKQFIAEQKLFFVATAAADGRVNVSPKGMDSLRVLDGNRVIWLSLTGSGNETSAHVQQKPRMTIMFAALAGKPLILRLYGNARVIHKNDDEWDTLFDKFDPLPGARQIFDVTIDLVQTSCGMGVPLFDYVSDRSELNAWANKKGPDGLKAYWKQKNDVSLDSFPTGIMEKNT
jgi:hypothetical protein